MSSFGRSLIIREVNFIKACFSTFLSIFYCFFFDNNFIRSGVHDYAKKQREGAEQSKDPLKVSCYGNRFNPGARPVAGSLNRFSPARLSEFVKLCG
jgi:hypothetical protein